MNRNIIKGLAVVGALSIGSAANAAVDVTALTTGITDTQAAVLSIIAALTGLSVAIFGVSKVYAFIKRKAGA